MLGLGAQPNQCGVNAEDLADPVRCQGFGGRPIGNDPAPLDDDHPREEVRGQPQVVEHRDDGRAVALIEVDEELHDLNNSSLKVQRTPFGFSCEHCHAPSAQVDLSVQEVAVPLVRLLVRLCILPFRMQMDRLLKVFNNHILLLLHFHYQKMRKILR